MNSHSIYAPFMHYPLLAASEKLGQYPKNEASGPAEGRRRDLKRVAGSAQMTSQAN